MFDLLTLGLVAVNAVAQIRCVIVCAAVHLTHEDPPVVPDLPSELPMVAVQIAAYREARAMPAMIEAVVAMNWPRDRMKIQVLDDSTGDDAQATRDVLDGFRDCGVSIEYINRGNRDGFKAGALNAGLKAASGASLIAYFDSDCRPRPNFLTQTVPRITGDTQAAGVQARWEYPNSLKSPLTMAQQAAFEYLFRYEYGVRTLLAIPVPYLGSAAVWRREVLEELGGWHFVPFTAEDVDMSYRAGNGGWKVLYEPSVVADNDAVEEILAFRAQQRRWGRAVTQAGLSARRGLSGPYWPKIRPLLELTGGMPHATVPLTFLTTVAIALRTLSGSRTSRAQNAAEWLFLPLFFLSPSILAMMSAMRYFHSRHWREHLLMLAKAGPIAAATMTGFTFGLADLSLAKPTEFVATPKAGQVAVVKGSRRRWLDMHYAPLVFDGIVSAVLLSASLIAFRRKKSQAALPEAALGIAFACSLVQASKAIRVHRAKVGKR